MGRNEKSITCGWCSQSYGQLKCAKDALFAVDLYSSNNAIIIAWNN